MEQASEPTLGQAHQCPDHDHHYNDDHPDDHDRHYDDDHPDDRDHEANDQYEMGREGR